MLALRPLFRPLPGGRMLLAGPAVAAIAELLGAPLLAPGTVADDPIVAVETEDPADVAATLDGRVFHLIVGGMWHELARLQPAVVSAAGPRFLLPAVAVAHAWGVPLGLIAAPTLVPLDAVIVAMDIRATLGLDNDRPSATSRAMTRP